MTITIKNHGTWERYYPEVFNEDGKNISDLYMFVRNTKSKKDFNDVRDTILEEHTINLAAEKVGVHYNITSVSYGLIPVFPDEKFLFTVEGWEGPYEGLIGYRINGRTKQLEKIPDEKPTSADVNAERDRRIEESVVVVDGVTYDATNQSLSNLNSAVNLSPDEVIEWITADNTVTKLDYVQRRKVQNSVMKSINHHYLAALKIKQTEPIPVNFREDSYWTYKETK